MSTSILGASGLSSKKKTEPANGQPLDHTGQTGPAVQNGSVPKPAVEAVPETPTPSGGNVTVASGDEQEADRAQGGGVKERDAAPVAAAPQRKKKKAESQPQTVYFGAGDREKAIDIEYALRRSGKFKGLVRGHISISLVMRTALDLLLQEFHDDPDGVIDRAYRVQLQGVHGKP